MKWRNWISGTALFIFVGGQIAPAYTHTLDWKKHYHLHAELHTTGSTVIVPPTDTRITPGTGALKIEVEERVRVGLNERVDIEKTEKGEGPPVK